MEKELTPRQKALEIYDKMEVDVNDYVSQYPAYSHKQAKECSFVLIDEMINELNTINHERAKFWEQVKAELAGER